MTWDIRQGDALTLLSAMPSDSIHCVVTSPPYWGLRDYEVDGQLGLEKTPEEYVLKMVEVFREVRRVMRPDATLFLNLGDAYFSGAQRGVGSGKHGKVSQGSSLSGQPYENLCGECASSSGLSNLDKRSHPVSMFSSSMPVSSHAHRESLPDRPDSSHSSVQADHNLNAILDSTPSLSHVSELPDASVESTHLQFSDVQIQDASSPPRVVDDPLKLSSCDSCGQQFVPKKVDHDAEDQPTLCSSSKSGQKKNISDKDETAGGVVDCTENRDGIDRVSYLDYSIMSHLKPKDLIGLPWRVAFALQADGWYIRSDIIWAKPNPMPESVTDRPTKSHEYLFLLTKSAQYFFDQEAIRLPVTDSTFCRYEYGWHGNKSGNTTPDVELGTIAGNTFRQAKQTGKALKELMNNPTTRNIRTVWTIPTQPFPDAHFATFPEKLVEPCIRAGTSERGCCAKCGAPWEREVNKQFVQEGTTRHRGRDKGVVVEQDAKSMTMGDGGKIGHYDITTTGWHPTCSCHAETIPATVLDPFVGSGTTGVVAIKLQRSFIGLELNPSYVKMARQRIGEVMPLFEPLEVRR